MVSSESIEIKLANNKEIDNQEMLDEIKSFSETFNLLDMLKTKHKSITKKKSPRFSVLIKDCIDKMSKEELDPEYNITENQDTILNLVVFLNDLIQTGDRLFDSYFHEKSFDNLEEFIEKTTKLVLIPWQVQKYLKKLPFDETEAIIQTIMNLRDAAKMEVYLRKNPAEITAYQLIEFTEHRNGDFILFYSFLSPFLEKNLRFYVLEFFKKYVILDNLLDDMTDVYKDYKDKTFNILLWSLQNKNIKLDFIDSKDLKKALIEEGVYDFVYDLAMQYANLALSVFGDKQSRFIDYMRFLVEGSMAGLKIFKKYDYFEYLLDNPKKHEDITNLLLKPYPWSTTSFERVFR